MKKPNEKTLVIILSETRAWQFTFDKFKQNLLNVFDADLALCVANNEREDRQNPFYKEAKYIWQSEEYDDWGRGLEELISDYQADWRKVANIKDQWLGGIKTNPQHKGSAGILLYFRAFLKKCLEESGVLEVYDRIIITRSDFIYNIPHLPPRYLDNQFIWIPNGEDYGGYTDRHILCPTKYILEVLSVAENILKEPNQLIKQLNNYNYWNLESYLKFAYHEKGLGKLIKRFPYIMYAVKAKNAHTSWSQGVYNEKFGYNIKYKHEYTSSQIASLIITKDWGFAGFHFTTIILNLYNLLIYIFRVSKRLIKLLISPRTS